MIQEIICKFTSDIERRYGKRGDYKMVLPKGLVLQIAVEWERDHIPYQMQTDYEGIIESITINTNNGCSVQLVDRQ